MPNYFTMSTAVVDQDAFDRSNKDLRNRQFILKFTYDYIYHALGLSLKDGLTASFIDRLKSELFLRQNLRSQDIPYMFWLDPKYDVVCVRIVNPHYNEVPEGVEPPAQFIS